MSKSLRPALQNDQDAAQDLQHDIRLYVAILGRAIDAVVTIWIRRDVCMVCYEIFTSDMNWRRRRQGLATRHETRRDETKLNFSPGPGARRLEARIAKWI